MAAAGVEERLQDGDRVARRAGGGGVGRVYEQDRPLLGCQRPLHGGVGGNERHVERLASLPELPSEPPGVCAGFVRVRADDDDAAAGLREVEPRLHPKDGDGERGAIGFQPVGLGADLVHGAVRGLHRLGRYDERYFLHDGSRAAQRIFDVGLDLMQEYEAGRVDGESDLRHSAILVGGTLDEEEDSNAGSHLAQVSFFLAPSGQRETSAFDFANDWRDRIPAMAGVDRIEFSAETNDVGGGHRDRAGAPRLSRADCRRGATEAGACGLRGRQPGGRLAHRGENVS